MNGKLLHWSAMNINPIPAKKSHQLQTYVWGKNLHMKINS